MTRIWTNKSTNLRYILGASCCLLVSACQTSSVKRNDIPADRVAESSEQQISPQDPPPCQVIHRSRAAMGTLFDLSLCVDEITPKVELIAEDVFKEISRIDSLMTSYRPDSHVSIINASAGKKEISVPEELYRIIEQSKVISSKTQGKFDISFASMGALWDFKTNQPTVPSRKTIRKKIKFIDYTKIRLNPKRTAVMLQDRDMRIGLGAIAKGYAVDRAGELLRARGISNYIVYGGGDLLIGGNKNGAPWKIGIQDPRDKSSYFAKLALSGHKAVVTSGDYEKYFEVDGRRYHHIIDPDTGFPATGSSSVTIVATGAALADAMATGVFVMGPEKGMRLVESEANLEGIIVDTELNVSVSSGLRANIELLGMSSKKKGTP